MPLTATEACDRAANAIAAIFDPAVQPLTGILVGAGDGELAASLLETFPQTSFWLIDQWKDVGLAAPASGVEDDLRSPSIVKSADRIRSVERKTAFAHDRRRVVNLTPQQASRRCPFQSIELVIINGMGTSTPVGPDAIRDLMLEQLNHWRERLTAGGKRFATSPAGPEPSDTEPRCALAYVDGDGHVVFYPGE